MAAHYKRMTKVRKYVPPLFRSFVFFSYFIAALALAATPDELRRGIDQKAKELEGLAIQIKAAQNQLEDIEEQKSTLQKELKKIDYTVSQLNLSIKASEITIEKLELELAALEGTIGETEERIARSQQAVTFLLRDLYERGREGTLPALLRGRTIAEAVAVTEASMRVGETLAEKVNELKALRGALKGTFAAKTDKKAAIVSENSTLKTRRGIVLDQKSDREVILAQTKNQEKQYQTQLAALEKRQEEMGKEIETLEAELRKSFDPSLLPVKRSGVLGYPVANPRMSQGYGRTAFARRAYATQFHNGVDFAVPIGTPVFASADGVVKAVGDNGRLQYGRYVLIEHENNLTTLYAHFSRQAVAKGAIVKKGEIIGYSGNTGYAFGPHIHLTVYWAPSVTLKSFPGAGLVPVGVTIDPQDYL